MGEGLMDETVLCVSMSSISSFHPHLFIIMSINVCDATTAFWWLVWWLVFDEKETEW